jgi:predicted membrane channel-forming protein YqfA (hemolysin III family)
MKALFAVFLAIGLIGCFVSIIVAASQDQWTKAIFFLILGKIYLDAFQKNIKPHRVNTYSIYLNMRYISCINHLASGDSWGMQQGD